MNNIEQIILSELEKMDGNCLDNEEERSQVASKLANVLISQSLHQLTTLFPNGGLEVDNDGQFVLYTGLNTDARIS